jgi:hypothetical protein
VITTSEFEQLTVSLWGAYEYLRTHDLTAESGTSKRLRAGNPAKLFDRLLEELAELRGVVEGTHFHEGFDSDIVLEGYEVWYWAACLAIANGKTYAEIEPHAAFLNGFNEATVKARPALLPAFDRLTVKLKEHNPVTLTAAHYQEVFYLVGRACRLNETHPARLLERDRAEMSQKPYLADYWQTQETAEI